MEKLPENDLTYSYLRHVVIVVTAVTTISLTPSCGTVALYGPFFFFLADHRATDFTYIKIGGIATRFKSYLSMVRLMIGCKCVLPCVVISSLVTENHQRTDVYFPAHAW
jgi:hypothetical protein